MLDEEKLHKQTRRTSIKEGSAAAIMSGAGDAYITPYALELKANNLEISLISSLASFLGPITQIIGSRLIEKHNRKTIVFYGVLLQASTWLLLITLGFIFLWFGKTFYLIPLLILSYIIYSASGSLGGPAWFSLLGDAVPEHSRGHYFSKRNRITGTISTITTLLASVWLYYAKEYLFLVPAFMVLFAICAIARFISAYYLNQHYARKIELQYDYYFSFWQFIKKATTNNFGRFAIYISLTNLSINIAGPFFAIYLWKELSLNPIVFTLVSISASLFSIISMPFWGKLADRNGNLWLLKIGSFLMIPASLFWLGSNNPWYIAFIPQMITGVGWGAFSLAASNFIYDAVTPARRAICVAYYNVLNGFGVLVGATLGGLFLQYIKLPFLNTFFWLFLFSSIMRLVITLLGLSTIKEVRKI